MNSEETREEETVLEEEPVLEEAAESEVKTEEPEKIEEVAEKVEEKPKPEKEAEEVVEERIYTVPFGRAWISPRKKRTPKAMRMLKGFVKKNMKVEDDSINVSKEVNEKIWGKGIEKPPRKIRIRAAKDKEGIVTVHLAEEN